MRRQVCVQLVNQEHKTKNRVKGLDQDQIADEERGSRPMYGRSGITESMGILSFDVGRRLMKKMAVRVALVKGKRAWQRMQRT
ncbi:hypothetical protein L1987_02649 [Smallanthus sonchifolius]|uniref:Uncharacterized protein n=1 Tax=Smallanthus sonchifolius TaxID=185202 RepID=A0ACB9K8K3_9ASTR|nr:hypothetical protein L1987_02649 [Smallanthus sonchifolius]